MVVWQLLIILWVEVSLSCLNAFFLFHSSHTMIAGIAYIIFLALSFPAYVHHFLRVVARYRSSNLNPAQVTNYFHSFWAMGAVRNRSLISSAHPVSQHLHFKTIGIPIVLTISFVGTLLLMSLHRKKDIL